MPKEVTILISEDEKLNFLLLKTLLQKSLDCNVNIIHAVNGQEAVDYCSDTIDLVLMDVEMPIMNGFDASVILKEKYPELPIIIQTAHCSKEHKERAALIGCNAFLPKPIVRKDFETILSQYVPIVC